MSYRKINVDGVDYRWMTWKTATKVQRLDKNGNVVGSKQYENVDWGTPLTASDHISGHEGPARYSNYGYKVSSGDVRGMILGVRHWKDKPCRRHPERIVTGLANDSFAAEIEQKQILVYNCPDCLYESWLNT